MKLLRNIAITCCYILIVSCSTEKEMTQSDVTENSASILDTSTKSPHKIFFEPNTKSDFIGLAIDIVLEKKITERDVECVRFVADDVMDKSRVVVEVREKHSEKCGGDINSSPKMFNLYFYLKDGTVKTDANIETGHLMYLN